MMVAALFAAAAAALLPAAPSPSPTPLRTIIRIKTTPFCDVFRQDVFHAVQGLRINDLVIDQGQSIIAKWAYDSVVDSGKGRGASLKMDQYQLGQVVGQASHNLQRIVALLDDPDRFPNVPQNDAERDLLAMKATLQGVVDAQVRSLNILSGTYATSALYDLLARGDNTAGALTKVSIGDQQLEIGDPILTAPGYITPPVTAVHPRGSLFSSTPIGQIHRAVTISQRITSDVEDRVADAVKPAVTRCR